MKRILPPAPRAEVYAAIDGERAYQKKWENPDVTTSGGQHTNMEFLVFIQDYTNEALHFGSRKGDPEAQMFMAHSLRKIAALAVAALEQNGVLPRALEAPRG